MPPGAPGTNKGTNECPIPPSGAGSLPGSPRWRPAGLVAGTPALANAQSAGSAGSAGSAEPPAAPAAAPAAMPFGGNEDPDNQRGILGAGCVYDAVQSWVQLCEVWSPAMNRHIKVQVQPARQAGGNAGLYLLDGLRARDDWNAWTHDAQAQRIFLMDNITLVMPVGGQVSFYSDWERPINLDGNLLEYKWETFLTEELPVTCSGSSACREQQRRLACPWAAPRPRCSPRTTDQFKQVSVFSGYMNLPPGMYSMIPLAMFDRCKCDVRHVGPARLPARVRTIRSQRGQAAGCRCTSPRLGHPGSDQPSACRPCSTRSTASSSRLSAAPPWPSSTMTPRPTTAL